MSRQLQASVFVVVFGVAMLALVLIAIIWRAATVEPDPTMRLVSTGFEPPLELPATCHFHSFISHAW